MVLRILTFLKELQMKAGKEYADTIVAKLRKVELSVIEGIRMERMQQLNERIWIYLQNFSTNH